MNNEDVVNLTANEKMLYDLAWEPISYCYVTDTPTLLPTVTPSSSPTTGSPSRMPTDEVSSTICFILYVLLKRISSTQLSSFISHHNIAIIKTFIPSDNKAYQASIITTIRHTISFSHNTLNNKITNRYKMVSRCRIKYQTMYIWK